MNFVRIGGRIVRTAELRIDSERTVAKLPDGEQCDMAAERERKIRELQIVYAGAFRPYRRKKLLKCGKVPIFTVAGCCRLETSGNKVAEHRGQRPSIVDGRP